MSDFSVLQEGRLRRSVREEQARRSRRRRRIRSVALMIAVGIVVLLAFMASGVRDPASVTKQPSGSAHVLTRPTPQHHPGYTLAPATRLLHVNFKQPPRAAVLFEIRNGKVLWARNATRRLPIASLTKMMTALVVAQHSRPRDRVLITRAATHFSGSGVGLLPLHKRVSELSLLYGLMLPSGNDAAIALAQHVSGNQARFVGMMNAEARKMQLRCTHFASVSGIVDRRNYSCAADLAVLAHALLEQPLLRRIVRSRSAVMPFPIKGGKLYLYNNNPLMYLRYRGIDGVKTGYTVAAGQCLVAAARRGRRWFGAVLLHSVNTPGQGQKLLNAAFAHAH